MQRRFFAIRAWGLSLVAGLALAAGCNLIGGGPVPNPFPPIPDGGVIVHVQNEAGIIVDATIVYTDDGVEVRRTTLAVPTTSGGQFVAIDRTVADRVIALAVVSDKNTGPLPGNLKVGDALFARVFEQVTDFKDGDILTIIIRNETPAPNPFPDCNSNNVPDVFEIALGAARDCNENGIPDDCDIAKGTSQDCNGDGVPNECEIEAPVITHCPADRQIAVSAGCTAAMPDLRGELSATDNCTATSALTIAQLPAPGDPISVGPAIAVTFTVGDSDGRQTTCSANVTVVDHTPPVIQHCLTSTTVLVDTKCTATVPDLTAELALSDNCTPTANLVVSQTPEAGSNAPIGTPIPVIVRVRDASGNESQCTTHVAFVDGVAPSLSCPEDVLLECGTPLDPGPESPTGQAFAFDDCDDEPIVTHHDQPFQPTGGDGGDALQSGGTGACLSGILRTWTATDASGNSSTCTQTIVLEDTIAPSIECPPAATVECGDSLDPSNPALGAPSVTDGCDPEPTFDYFDDTGESTCPVKATVTRTWYAYDACGNYSSCDQSITVMDTQPPILTIPGDDTIDCDSVIDPTRTGSATAVDACTSEPSVTYSDHSVFEDSACPNYTIRRRWKAVDDCGNQTCAVQNIYVVDAFPPIINDCPAPTTQPVGPDCTAAVPDFREGFSFVDVCTPPETILPVVQSPAPGTPVGPGTYNVSITVTDLCGNASVCDTTFTVDPTVLGGIIYVDRSAEGRDDGSSWGDAFNDLAIALGRAACAGTPVQVWVAQGTYRPDSYTNNRYTSFVLHDNVAVYGGFIGNETALGQRDPLAYVTILTGNIGGSSLIDNSFHVVNGSHVGPSAVLDGFTIADGNADMASGADEAGGIWINGGSPTIRGCTLSNNRALNNGGAIHCRFGCQAQIENCTFLNNTATSGGAIRNWADARPTLVNCRFSGNTATRGGAIENNADSWPIYVNCLFNGNSAEGGGAISEAGGQPTYVNCTIYGNNAGVARGGGIRAAIGDLTLVNCVLWGNTESPPINVVGAQIFDITSNLNVSYSCIQDSESGDGSIPFGGAAAHNIDAYPVFLNAAGGNFALGFGSPCIDTGSNAAVPAGVTTDLVGHPRIIDGDHNETATVDMGALESTGIGS